LIKRLLTYQNRHLDLFFSSYPFNWKYSIATQSSTGHGISEKCLHYFHFWKNYLAWSAGHRKSYSY